jgi:hypothetical protein
MSVILKGLYDAPIVSEYARRRQALFAITLYFRRLLLRDLSDALIASHWEMEMLKILIVVFPCMLIITQLLFQQNALVY